MKLVIEVPGGSSAKVIAAELRFQADCIEGVEAKKAAKAKPSDFEEEDSGFDVSEDNTEPEIEDLSTDTEDIEPSFGEDEEEDNEPKKSKGKATPVAQVKTKKITSNDVNNACKAKAKATSIEKVRAILKKFGVKSVTSLKENQYAAVIKAMKV